MILFRNRRGDWIEPSFQFQHDANALSVCFPNLPKPPINKEPYLFDIKIIYPINAVTHAKCICTYYTYICVYR